MIEGWAGRPSPASDPRSDSRARGLGAGQGTRPTFGCDQSCNRILRASGREPQGLRRWRVWNAWGEILSPRWRGVSAETEKCRGAGAPASIQEKPETVPTGWRRDLMNAGMRDLRVALSPNGCSVSSAAPFRALLPKSPQKPYGRESALRRNMPRPNRAPPIRLNVAGSGTPLISLTVP